MEMDNTITKDELEEERQEVREQILKLMKIMQIIAYITLLITISAVFYDMMKYGLISVAILIIYSTWKLGKAIKKKQTEMKENEA